jgi:hypothetical protein
MAASGVLRRLVRYAAAGAVLLVVATAAAQGCFVDDGSTSSAMPGDWGGATCALGAASSERHIGYYTITVRSPERRLALTATTSGMQEVDLCLSVGDTDHCRSATGSVALPDLVLPPGPYALRFVGRGPTGGTFRIALDDLGPARDGFEREPNDVVARATPLGPDLAMRGRFEGRESDAYRIDVVGDPLLWRVQVVGAEVEVLRFHDASGRVVQERRREDGERSVRLSNLYLPPGSHVVSVQGRDGDYAIRFIELGPAEPPATVTASGAVAASAASAAGRGPPASSGNATDMVVPRPVGPPPPGRLEREPNDDEARAHRLVPGASWVGLLADAGDVDVYRFSMRQEGLVRITVTPPPGGAVDVRAAGTFGAAPRDTPFVHVGWYLAGDHVVAVRAADRVDGYYSVILERLDPFTLPDDLEPNDAPYQARPLGPDHRASGAVGTHRDDDWYLLPALDRERDVTFRLEGDGAALGNVRSPTREGVVSEIRRERSTGLYVARVPAGGPYALPVRGTGPYDLSLSFDPPIASAPRPAAPTVSVRVRSTSPVVAAYHPRAQRVELELELEHAGTAPLVVDLAGHVSDARWRLELPSSRVTLAAGETHRSTLALTILPDARDDLDVVVTVAAVSADGGVASGAVTLAAVCGAPLLEPRAFWPLPDRLLGGIDVAARRHGSEPQTAARRELLLYDGFARVGDGFAADPGGATTVRLAGDAPPLVTGVLLHPLGMGEIGTTLADFRVATSLDGISFVTALEGRLSSVIEEQAFVLDPPRAARFVRLELVSRQDGNPRGPIHLGLFKVIAEPEANALSGPVDLARREVGGQVVRASPHLPLDAFETIGSRPRTVRLEPGVEEVSLVLGFHDHRAARLDALVWHPHPTSDPAQRLVSVDVGVSTGDALGPWSPLGVWRPHESPTWRFETPVWARYVRVVASGLEPRATVEWPAAIEVHERAAGQGYRSILGEWGHTARAAAFEWLQEPLTEAAAWAAHGEVRSALVLAPGRTAVSRVLLGEEEAWFRSDVPAGDNHLRLDLRGDDGAGIAFRYALMDAAERPIAFTEVPAPGGVVLEAHVEPGSYYLRTWEPPRSVVFSWDDSGSMGPFVTTTYATIAAFARSVSAEREVVQLQAFGRNPAFLLAAWTGDPETLLSALVGYDRRNDSSDAEKNLAFVVRALGEREGTRAVMLVTDAESGANAAATQELWEALEAVRPRVFTFETSTGGSPSSQDRMQAWAVDGVYDGSGTPGALEVGFARASCRLRAPKRVEVTARTAAVAPPGPGTLVVSGAADAALAGVHVVFDASGSMGKPLAGGATTRIQAARAALVELVEELVAPGTPFGLRAYGHVRPTACDTRLELALGPLDRAAARRAVAGIEPKLLSGTPLAASLEAVAQDLRGARGPVTVIVLTDGEESCGGDLATAVQALRASRPDVRLVFIGFDLDAADRATALREFALLVEPTGGRVFDTSDTEALRAALETALVRDVPFEVLAGDGEVVATGRLGGDALTLPAGLYAIRVATTPVVVRDGVRIVPDSLTTVVVDGAP